VKYNNGILSDNKKIVSEFTLPYLSFEIKSITGIQQTFSSNAMRDAIIICHSRKKKIWFIFSDDLCKRVNKGVMMGAIISCGNVETSKILYANLYSASLLFEIINPISIQSNLDIIAEKNTTPVCGRDSFNNSICLCLFQRNLRGSRKREPAIKTHKISSGQVT
jgi:hypothetical protein